MCQKPRVDIQEIRLIINQQNLVELQSFCTLKNKNSSLGGESPQCEQNPLPGREQKEESDLKTKHGDIK